MEVQFKIARFSNVYIGIRVRGLHTVRITEETLRQIEAEYATISPGDDFVTDHEMYPTYVGESYGYWVFKEAQIL